jgi:hypothetical protein
MPTASEVPNAHAIEIAEFIYKPAGQSLIHALTARRPNMRAATLEEQALKSREALGWENCINEILTICSERGETVDLGESKPINPSLADDKDPKYRPTGKV